MAGVGVVLVSCQAVELSDQASLSRVGMSFGETGARQVECGLVNQVERGRATSSSSAGGGCSACH